ncbi:MAG: ATP-binding cassette domain-containing protein [Alphaproteobacteria bacterium]|nr:ATP-binding cassette domain-containing protein [Alphaproteobacteria bacterium]
MTETLKIRGMSIQSATRRVVDGISIDVPAGQIVALLGPNGAGKSELILGIAGAMAATGTVSIGSQTVSGNGIQGIREAGIAAVPEGHQVLSGMSVRDNLRASGPMLSDDDLAVEVANALEIFPELRKLIDQIAGSMSGGQQQMLSIAQALISRPKFLLIDEMSLGLAPVIIDRLVGVIQGLRSRGIGILLIEQFTQLALDVSDHAYVMARGKLQFSGSPGELKHDPGILEKAYLG